MVCYSPRYVYRDFQNLTVNGKASIKSLAPSLVEILAKGGKIDASLDIDAFQIPCSKCVGCRLDYSQGWAVRCMHEASLFQKNCFLTLTYSKEFLPSDNSLDKDAFPLFMKRLRKKFVPRAPKGEKLAFEDKVRYFYCGEYGKDRGRPHYHACLFNIDFDDKVLHKIEKGNRLYISKTLSDLWPWGWAYIGSLTFQSAAYVARYVMKKQTGKGAEEHYQGKVPEYAKMSTNPGIGRVWLDRYLSDVYPHGYVIQKNRKIKTPRYYDGVFEKLDPIGYQSLKEARRMRAEESTDNTFDRLKVKEYIKKDKLKKLYRTLDDAL